KTALNGSLNCSVRDGWWDELFDGENGWAIASADTYEDLAWRDQVEAGNLFDLLERHIVPLFYERQEGLPERWLARMRASLRSLGPEVTAARMLREYVERLYEPLAARASPRCAGEAWVTRPTSTATRVRSRATRPAATASPCGSSPPTRT